MLLEKSDFMYEKLLELLNNSHSPYSKFRVAAIVTLKDGNSFSGVNVENASYGATICAERSAIVSAVSNGYKKGDFDKLYILCGDSNKISTCCFLCRQVIMEFFDKNSEIICYDKIGNSKSFSIDELCPYSFDSGDLI